MIRVQVNRGLDGKFKKLEELVENFQEEYLRGMSDQIVLRSPVDTGTYMDGHHVGTTAVAATDSSRNSDRQQPYGPHANDALYRLYMMASRIPQNTSQVIFSNSAFHADVVEYELGYAPMRSAAREHNRIASEAEARARARTR